MATLAEIRATPTSYLGEGDPEDYDLFVRAVEALMAEGMAEDEAVRLVWNDGDWVPVATGIVRDDWRPTHAVIAR